MFHVIRQTLRSAYLSMMGTLQTCSWYSYYQWS